MQDIRLNNNSVFYINDINYICLSRNEGYSYCHNNGKEKYSLIFIQSGAMKYFFTNENEVISAPKGSMCFIPPYRPYKNKYEKFETSIKLLEFSVEAKSKPSFLENVCVLSSSEIKSLFAGIDNKTMMSTLFLAGRIYELLYQIENSHNEIPKKYKKIMPALNQINECYFENKNINYYAKMCYMSDSNFRKLFKEYTGKSFIDYRNSIRIAQAKKLIGSGECSITEAAYLTGFNNMSFFYELMQKYENV